MNDFAGAVGNQGLEQVINTNRGTIEHTADIYSDIVYTYKGFDLYTVDLKNTPHHKLDAIIKKCEAVEKACWDAQENFYQYAVKRDLLTYAVHHGEIIGFQISSYWIMDSYFIFDLDETMVLRKYRGNNLAMALSAVNCRTFYLKISKMKNIKKMTFISVTPNLKLINLLDRLRHIIRVLDNTFNPSPNLMKINQYIVEKKGATLVHPDYPFFLKGVFPGSLNPVDCSHNTSKRIEKMIPPGIDFHGRGDAFLFISCFGKLRLWPIMVVLLIKALGFGIFTNTNLGLLSRRKYKHVNKYLTVGNNIRIERRKNDRRVSSGIPDNADFVERRRYDRRAEVFKQVF